MHKQDLVLNNPQGLICHETQLNNAETKKEKHFFTTNFSLFNLQKTFL